MERSGRLMGIALGMLLSFTVVASPSKVIYGEDNRVDVINSTNNLHIELANSTAAMISSSSLTKSEDGQIKIGGKSFQSRMGMCADEAFVKQLSAANCSGFLVGEDLLVTAGHCIRSEADCARYSWVFDFRVENDEQTSHTVAASSVYKCSAIIERSLDRSTQDDYALIKLERKVTDREPLQYRTSGSVEVGDELVVIGHPSGIPTKIADGAEVKGQNSVYFTANLDTYGGNSGSAVFNSTTGVIEGILVRGQSDYVYRNGCRASNRLSDDHGRYEDITKITNIKGLNSL